MKSPLIGRYCGSNRFEQPIMTNSNEVTLVFKSNFSTTSEGFIIKYETCTYIYFSLYYNSIHICMVFIKVGISYNL